MNISTSQRDVDAFEKMFEEARQDGLVAAGIDKPLWKKPYDEPTYECRVRFLYDKVWTFNDQARKSMQVPQKGYLEYICWHWSDTWELGEPLFLFKARRLIVSWTLRGLELHDMGLSRCKQAVVDETYTKSRGHVWRYAHIYAQLRASNMAWALPKAMTYGALDGQELDRFVLPNASIGLAINQEAANFQGSGLNGVTLEEFGLYKEPNEMISQAAFVTQASEGYRSGHVVLVGNAVHTEEFVKLVERPEKNG